MISIKVQGDWPLLFQQFRLLAAEVKFKSKSSRERKKKSI